MPIRVCKKRDRSREPKARLVSAPYTERNWKRCPTPEYLCSFNSTLVSWLHLENQPMYVVPTATVGLMWLKSAVLRQLSCWIYRTKTVLSPKSHVKKGSDLSDRLHQWLLSLSTKQASGQLAGKYSWLTHFLHINSSHYIQHLGPLVHTLPYHYLV